jgi:uncharacterized protein
VICLAASLPAVAQVGPSFDCERAALVDERLICSDPTLRQADRDVAVLYRRVLETRQGARREELRLDQRNWLLQRNKECGVFKTTKIAEADRLDYVHCFLDAYAERKDDLAAMRAAGQRRWAKTDCSTFWAVSARTGASELRCIPYGPYYQNAPIPLPTKGGLYFATVGKTAAADDGLYSANGNEIERVVAGRIVFPSVSPDGCRIAFGLDKTEAAGKLPVVSAWDACAR